ncbi:MAG: ABC transporter permease [Candidatus Bipolaricaulota bacterium]|nr:ABC transporter permease [Candidatus Bipolaricaulota bacterium]
MATVGGRSEAWRSFRVAAWLGWQIESNWADPFVFAIYSLVKPLAGALILVFMYAVIAKDGLQSPLFPGVFVGNALFIYVPAVLAGISWTIIEDREHYGMLEYVYTAPVNVFAYLIGRGVAKALVATVAVVIMLLLGTLALGVPVRLAGIDWPLVAAALVLGSAMLSLFGILLGGVTMITARHNYGVGEAVAGGLYLLCGVVFPLDSLPTWLSTIGRGIPITYWLEAFRRALLGRGTPSFAGLSDGALVGIIAGSTAVLAVLAVLGFRLAERRARAKGLLDMQTMY